VRIWLTFDLCRDVAFQVQAAKKYKKEIAVMSNPENLENGNGGTPESAVKFPPGYKPETIEDLFEYVKRLKSNEENSLIITRYQLGITINNFYKKNYGTDELQKIAEASGYSKSTLHKACQFAKDFTDGRVAELLEGPFQISWRDISQNLRVNPDDFVKAYLQSATVDEFRNAVTELKDPDEVKLKRLYMHKKGRLNREYRLLMENQIEYRDFQLNMKELEIADLKERMAELTDKLALYEKKVSKSNTTDQIDDAMDQNLSAMAA